MRFLVVRLRICRRRDREQTARRRLSRPLTVARGRSWLIEAEKRKGEQPTHWRSKKRERSQSSRRLNNCLALEWPPVNSRSRFLDVPRSEWRVSPQRHRARRMSEVGSGARSAEKDRDSRDVRVRECHCRAREQRVRVHSHEPVYPEWPK